MLCTWVAPALWDSSSIVTSFCEIPTGTEDWAPTVGKAFSSLSCFTIKEWWSPSTTSAVSKTKLVCHLNSALTQFGNKLQCDYKVSWESWVLKHNVYTVEKFACFYYKEGTRKTEIQKTEFSPPITAGVLAIL